MGTEPDSLNVAGYGGTHGSNLGALAVQAGGKVNTGLMSHILPVSEAVGAHMEISWAQVAVSCLSASFPLSSVQAQGDLAGLPS